MQASGVLCTSTCYLPTAGQQRGLSRHACPCLSSPLGPSAPAILRGAASRAISSAPRHPMHGLRARSAAPT